jgi:hypothetical protein
LVIRRTSIIEAVLPFTWAGRASINHHIMETKMADDPKQAHGQDRERINVNQEYELRHWAKSLGTTPERLKEAVRACGSDRADRVREYLKSERPGG